VNPAEVVLDGSLLLALPIATAAGLLSFFSPCVLPLVPAYLAYVTGLAPAELPALQARSLGDGGTAVAVAAPRAAVRSRVVLGTVLFVAGFTAVFVAYGAIAGSLGGLLLTQQRTLTVVLGVVTILLGLAFAGWLPGLDRTVRLRDPARGGLAAAPLLGVVFGLGWTPCIGPTLAAVQVLAIDEGTALRGALLSVAYCVGLGLPFLAVGLGYRRALAASDWVRRHQRAVQRVGGLALVLLGLALVSGVWGAAVASLQGWVGGFEVPL
jgi:cytochrome c-type biogenesis protein